MERTSNIIDDEYSEIVLYVTELRRKFHRKFENQMFVIDQQRVRIDYQQRQIDDQRVVIDELAWQIRDLRDSVRQCTEKIYAHTYDGCSNCSTIRKDKGDSAPSDRAKLHRQNHVREKGEFRRHCNSIQSYFFHSAMEQWTNVVCSKQVKILSACDFGLYLIDVIVIEYITDMQSIIFRIKIIE